MEESRKKREELYNKCKHLLLEKKQSLVNGMKLIDPTLAQHYGGDEADMAQIYIEQNTTIAQRERANFLLREIDEALDRLDQEAFGICEETEEPIESQRLLAMPWTRLSLKGAEMREAIRKRFA